MRDWLIAGIALSATTPVDARDRAPNRITAAAGALIVSDYEGGSRYSLAPAIGAFARLRGHAISWKGTSIAIDLVPEYRDQRAKFVAGPFVSVRLDRSETPRDPVVALLRKRKVAVEGGGFAGWTKSGVLTSPYDSLSLKLSASMDLGNVHHGFIVTPTVDYLMPISKAVLLGASASADIVGAHYARYYYGVGPRGSAASGLPQYRPDGGLKSVTLGLLGAVSLHGDLRRGFAVGVNVNYERLLGGFARSPLVAIRGNANQVIAVAGVAYTF